MCPSTAPRASAEKPSAISAAGRVHRFITPSFCGTGRKWQAGVRPDGGDQVHDLVDDGGERRGEGWRKALAGGHRLDADPDADGPGRATAEVPCEGEEGAGSTR
jgi:hypothetical protein